MNLRNELKPSVSAIVLAEGEFGKAGSKTAHSVVTHSDLFAVTVVVDSETAGETPSDVLDRPDAPDVPIVPSVAEALSRESNSSRRTIATAATAASRTGQTAPFCSGIRTRISDQFESQASVRFAAAFDASEVAVKRA